MFRFLVSITEAQQKLPAGSMKDSRVLNSIMLTISGAAFSIAVEATESFPGCHLINKATMGKLPALVYYKY